MKILGIIPARYASTRFPAKALTKIEGMPMVFRTYSQALKAGSLDKVVIATDHEKIYSTVEKLGAQVVMTKETHPSGTDRCAEAMDLMQNNYDYVINIQGDEPFIQPGQIDELADLLDGKVELATLVTPVKNQDDLTNPGVMKVVINQAGFAMYFSREPIPHVRGVEKSEWIHHHRFYKHVCMYAYRNDILKKITQLPISSLEKAESLEQLRWLENNYQIKIGVTELTSISIDTPSDLQKALKIYQK